MIKLPKIFNESANRRTQNLSFVGRERREIVQIAIEERLHAGKNDAFLAGIENIKDIKKLA